MTTLWELIAGSIVLGWVFSTLPFLRGSMALAYALGAGLVGLSGIWGFQFGGVFIATFAPFGVMLPVLCLAASMTRQGHVDLPSISPWEKLAWAGVMLIVVLGTIGTVEAHPYAWFYNGWEPLAGAYLLALWAFLRRQIHVLLAVLLGQVLWMLDVGSSNLYDQLTHVLLIPALVISAVRQGLRDLAKPRTPA